MDSTVATSRAPVRPNPLLWAGLCLVFALVDFVLLRVLAPGLDWGPLWAAGRIASANPLGVYDFGLVTAMQESLFGPIPVRPFVYPPTALLLFMPFSALPFWTSFAVFTAASAILLARSGIAVGSNRLLLVLAPPVVLAGLAGQPTLLVTALAIAGCARLRRDETGAGVIFGIAAMLKPPLLLLAPLGLLAGRHWRALGWAVVTAGALACVSLLLFGLQAWIAWFDALPRFQELFAGYEPLLRNAATPYALALRLGMEPWWVPLAAAAVAFPAVVLIFARTDDPLLRSVAMLGGALLVAPYAMHYELAVLAPAVAAMRLQRPSDAVLPAIWGASILANASLIGLLAVYGWALAKLARLPRSDGEDRPVERGVHVPA